MDRALALIRRLAAVFLLLLVACDTSFSPDESRVITETGPEALRLEALAFADAFLARLDRGEIESTFPLLADFLREQIDETKWVSTIATLRATAGTSERRTRLGYGYAKELEGAPRGRYFIIQYLSVFDRLEWNERLVVGQRGDTWAVAGYSMTKRG